MLPSKAEKVKCIGQQAAFNACVWLETTRNQNGICALVALHIIAGTACTSNCCKCHLQEKIFQQGL